MLVKKLPGLPDVDSDDAPELTSNLLEGGEVFEGDRFVRRGRGRPALDSTKEKINVRIDPEVLEILRSAGPGWQTRINARLNKLTGVDRQSWNMAELFIAENEKRIKILEEVVQMLEDGTMHSFTNNVDTSHECLSRNLNGIEQLKNGSKIMRHMQADIFMVPTKNS